MARRTFRAPAPGAYRSALNLEALDFDAIQQRAGIELSADLREQCCRLLRHYERDFHTEKAAPPMEHVGRKYRKVRGLAHAIRVDSDQLRREFPESRRLKEHDEEYAARAAATAAPSDSAAQEGLRQATLARTAAEAIIEHMAREIDEVFPGGQFLFSETITQLNDLATIVETMAEKLMARHDDQKTHRRGPEDGYALRKFVFRLADLFESAGGVVTASRDHTRATKPSKFVQFVVDLYPAIPQELRIYAGYDANRRPHDWWFQLSDLIANLLSARRRAMAEAAGQ